MSWFLLTSVLASAQVVPTERFEGAIQESWLGAPEDVPDCVDFADIGTFCCGAAMISRRWTSRDCSLGTPEEPPYFGSAMNAVEGSFTTGLTRFGGWFGAFDADRATVRFFDAQGDLIGQETLDLPPCGWRWRGWELARPAYGIEVQSSFWSGGFVMMDGLQADGPPPFADDGTCAPEVDPEAYADRLEWCDNGLDDDCDGVVDGAPCESGRGGKGDRDPGRDEARAHGDNDGLLPQCGCEGESDPLPPWGAAMGLTGLAVRRRRTEADRR